MTVAWTSSYKNNKCSSSSTEKILLASNRTIESQSFLARLPDFRGLLNSEQLYFQLLPEVEKGIDFFSRKPTEEYFSFLRKRL